MVQYKYIIKAIEKTYHDKPHLDSLPYDLTTRDPKKLKERLKEIKNRIKDTEELIASEKWIQQDRQNAIDELNNKNKELQNNIDSMNKIENDFQEINQSLKKDAVDKVNNIVDKLEKYLNGEDLPNDPFGTNTTDYYYKDFNRLKELFESGGLINGQEANIIRGLGNALMVNVGDDNEMMSIVDDLRSLADDHNINNNKNASDLLEEYYSFGAGQSYFQRQIDKNNKEINRSEDVIKDSKKTERHLNVELKDYKNEEVRTNNYKERIEKD